MTGIVGLSEREYNRLRRIETEIGRLQLERDEALAEAERLRRQLADAGDLLAHFRAEVASLRQAAVTHERAAGRLGG